MMRGLISLIVLLVGLHLQPSAQASVDLTDSERAYLDQLPELRLCEQFDIYPLSGMRDGRMVGMRGEVFDEIVRRTGLKFQPIGANSAKQLREMVAAGRCDLIGSMGGASTIYNEAMNKTETVMAFPYAVLGDLQSFNLDSFTDLSDRTFIVRFPNIGKTIKAAYPEVSIEVINDVAQAMAAVGGQTHFVALRPVVERTIQEYGFDRYKLNGVLDKINQQSVIGVSRRYPELLPILNKVIGSIEPSYFDFVRNKYSIREFTVVQSYLWLWYVAAGLSALILLLLYRSVILQRQNREIAARNAIIEEKSAALKRREFELETASRRIAMAAENAQCGFWIFEYGSNQTSWDEQVHAIWELEPESLSPEELFTFWSNSLDPKDLQRVLDNEARLFREGAPGAMGQHRFEITTAKGNKRWVEATFTLLVEEGRSLLIGMNRDMTEDHALREQLQLAADKAVELAEAKSHFLANMSHEIRTPLNAVLGLAQQLTRRNRYPSEVVSHANRIVNAGQSLLSLLNDILDFSKLDSGKLQLNFRSVDLFDMLENLATLMTNSARNKQLELVIHSPEGFHAKVQADQLRLEQILINLIGNAIKFTDQGFVALDVEVLEQSESDVLLRLRVKDSGIGISRVDLQKLTAPFVQADASITRRFGGTGLGLSICKRLLTLYGTELEILSEPGLGTEFAFNLRLELSTNQRSDQTSAPGPRLMFADDQEIAREALLAAAKALGWEAQDYSSGSELLTRYEAALRAGQQIDLILLDWKMPELDGAETAKRVKELSFEYGLTEPPTVVMVTGYSLEHVEDVPQAQYIDRILEKPVTPIGLKNTYLDLTQGQTDKPAIESDTPLEGLRLLVVDDNLYNREVAKVVLESEGAQVEMVEDGQVAVDWVVKNADEVSAILMDVQMPIMDGLKATRVLRAHTQSQHIPIIGMSAGAFEEDIQAALDAGMNDYLTKPIDVHLAVEKLVHLLKPEKTARVEITQTKGAEQSQPDEQVLFNEKMALSIWQDHDKLARMLEAFVTEFSPKMEAERLVLEAVDAQAIHKMKGAAGAMFLQRLQSCLQTLERRLRAAESSAEEINTLSDVWQATLTEIANYLKQHPVSNQSSVTQDACEIPDPELQALLTACYSFDPDEVRPQINALKTAHSSALLQQVEALIDRLDFNTAAKLIGQELESRGIE